VAGAQKVVASPDAAREVVDDLDADPCSSSATTVAASGVSSAGTRMPEP